MNERRREEENVKCNGYACAPRFNARLCSKLYAKQILTNLADQIKGILKDTREYASKKIVAELPVIFKENKNLCRMACYSASVGRHDVFAQALADGWLSYDENTCRAVGAFMNI